MIEFKKELFDTYAQKSYSQEGEDMILWRIFSNRQTGFYVDVGAHHPKRFSNTYLFYKNGWSGINIDATPGSMARFKKLRSRDVNLEVAIAKERREIIFYMFNEPALNTLDEKYALSMENDKYRIIKKIRIETKTLKEILTEYLPKGQVIDFLSIDAEGIDFEVLQSNDWQLFRPGHVLIECLNLEENDISDLKDNEVYKFLVDKNYRFFAKTYNTVIFKENPV